MYASSPKWPTDWISPENLAKMLKILAGRIQGSPYGPKNVGLNYGLHFTGGEPFLNFGLLLEGVNMATRLGFPSLFAETNAFWCQHDEETENKMRKLQEAGLSGLLISVNPFTLESVPFDRTMRAINIGSDLFGQNLIVYQVDYFMQFRKLKITGRKSLQEFIQQVGLREATARIELLPIGRVAYTLNEWFEKYPTATFFDSNCSAELQRNYHNHWDNYGNVLPGFCAGIALGNLLDQPALYEEGLDLEKEYPLLGILYNRGVEGLYQYAHTHFNYQEHTNGYISKCHLCLDIRRHIVNQTQEFKELRPVEFYTRIDQHKA